MKTKKEQQAADLFLQKIRIFIATNSSCNEEVFKTIIFEKLEEAINEVDKDLDSSLVFLYAERELLELQLEQLKGIKK